ncbi:MAG: RdgB/HAM1 family non-canonical purine NTP pyrophosphatase [Chitinophagaceae bacterium]|nr:RdgB/HAM1 family non-canonical purine NTP pyrophosphatase [Chitinophagaceae bacterium]
MTQLIFASNNPHKVEEIQSAIGNMVDIVSLKQAGMEIEIPEPHDTLEANASEKSQTIYKLTNENCFSEDTGLEVYALNGEPGVKTARYAGDTVDTGKNIEKLLGNLGGIGDRRARFRTVISLIYEGKEYLFEGICEGQIIDHKRGSKGFGYDPVFMPSGSKRTFAEMDTVEKNVFSHRKKAADRLVLFLQEYII